MVRQALLLHMKLVIVVPLTDSTPIKTFTAADVEIVVPLPVADPLNMCLVPENTRLYSPLRHVS